MVKKRLNLFEFKLFIMYLSRWGRSLSYCDTKWWNKLEYFVLFGLYYCWAVCVEFHSVDLLTRLLSLLSFVFFGRNLSIMIRSLVIQCCLKKTNKQIYPSCCDMVPWFRNGIGIFHQTTNEWSLTIEFEQRLTIFQQ